MRLFIGVQPPAELQSELQQLIEAAKASAPGWRWTKTENLHFTLKFLGETAPEKLPALRESLRAVSQGMAPFLFKLGNPGIFPPQGIPRILWIDAAAGKSELVALAEQIDAACLRLGFAKEGKPFQCHLTIARASGARPIWPLPAAAAFSKTAEVRGFSLIESILRPEGPIYKSLEEFTF